MSVIACLLALLGLAIWSGLFAVLYGMSAFDRQLSPMWFLVGSLPIFTGALWLASRGGKRSAKIAALVIGIASHVTPGVYLWKEGLQGTGVGATSKRKNWAVTLVCSAIGTVTLSVMQIARIKSDQNDKEELP